MAKALCETVGLIYTQQQQASIDYLRSLIKTLEIHLKVLEEMQTLVSEDRKKIQQALRDKNISLVDLERRTSRSKQRINQVVNGKEVLSPKTLEWVWNAINSFGNSN